MSLLRIAWRSIQQRGVASSLTTLSMALGVMLVVCVLSIHGIVAQSFIQNSSLGYNMILGARGGSLQLTVNTVFYLSKPIETIPYDYYLECFPAEFRDAQYESSIQRTAHDALWEINELQSMTGIGGPGLIAASLVANNQLETQSGAQADYSSAFAHPVAGMRRGRAGRFSQMIDMAIPVCLGDYLSEFRVVGTTREFFEKLRFGPRADRKYEFASGRNLEHYTEEHGYFEAVLGATVAHKLKLDVGDKISPSHGGSENAAVHDEQFTVVGILDYSATPNDRAVFINIEGFFLMADHAKPVESDGTHDGTHEVAEPLPVEQREITSILVRTNPILAGPLANLINEGREAQAALPVGEIYSLFNVIIEPAQNVLLVITAMICIVSGVGILVSIYNSMSERRHEIAVMRALGAGRGTVMTVILFESILLALTGGIIGWILGHGLNWAASPLVEARTGVKLGFFDLAPPVNILELFRQEPTIEWLPTEWFQISPELWIIPALIVLAIVVGFLPALAAYRTDVARSLGK